jgi:hypothetical protein
MVEDRYTVNLLHLIYEVVARPDEFLEKNGWNRHGGLSYAHLSLQLFDDFLCDLDDFFKHSDLLLRSHH